MVRFEESGAVLVACGDRGIAVNFLRPMRPGEGPGTERDKER